MFRILAPLALVAFSACGKEVHFSKRAPVNGPTVASCLTNCSPISTATPTPTPAPVGVTLTVSAPSPAPSGSGWLNVGDGRFPTLRSAWDTFGASNASQSVVRGYQTTMTRTGQCILFQAKVTTSTNAPAANRGTFYNSTSAWKFQYCLDGKDVLVKYEDGGDSNFSDYTYRISAQGRQLSYQLDADGVLICLD